MDLKSPRLVHRVTHPPEAPFVQVDCRRLQAPRDDFRYFYDENNPASILAGMDRALSKLTKAP